MNNKGYKGKERASVTLWVSEVSEPFKQGSPPIPEGAWLPAGGASDLGAASLSSFVLSEPQFPLQ